MSLPRDPGSTANTAYDIGNLSGTENITEFIGATDSTDIYQFSLTETSTFSLEIDDNSYSGFLSAYLYIDSNQNGQIDDGELLYQDATPNGSWRSRYIDINSALGAADYFLSIERLRDDTNTSYNLNLSATPNPSSIDTDPGNTTDESYEIQYINLDTSEDNRTINEFVGSTDTTDIYKLSLEQTTNFNINIDENSYSGYVGAYLYIDSNQNGQIDDGELLYQDVTPNGSWRSRHIDLDSTLGAANYFLSIERLRDDTNTSYNLDITSIADPVSSVTVTAQDAEAREEGTNTGKFRITREGDTSNPYPSSVTLRD